jgi:hypothetical protein
MAGSCEYGDEPSGSGATELDSYTSLNVGLIPSITVYDFLIRNTTTRGHDNKTRAGPRLRKDCPCLM